MQLKIIVFDVNETLLDLSSLDVHFKNLFGDATVKMQWFAQLLQSSYVATITGNYHDFGVLAKDALQMVALRHKIDLSDKDKNIMLHSMKNLQPFPDVLEGFKRLKEADFSLAVFTNSSPSMITAQMENAGLTPYLDHILSVDGVKKFKPALEVYNYMAKTFAVELKDVLFVAAHHWDIIGAMNAGCQGAFIERPDKVLSPLQDKPKYICKDIAELAEQLILKC